MVGQQQDTALIGTETKWLHCQGRREGGYIAPRFLENLRGLGCHAVVLLSLSFPSEKGSTASGNKEPYNNGGLIGQERGGGGGGEVGGGHGFGGGGGD